MVKYSVKYLLSILFCYCYPLFHLPTQSSQNEYNLADFDSALSHLALVSSRARPKERRCKSSPILDLTGKDANSLSWSAGSIMAEGNYILPESVHGWLGAKIGTGAALLYSKRHMLGGC